jgi:hypothetical protein
MSDRRRSTVSRMVAVHDLGIAHLPACLGKEVYIVHVGMSEGLWTNVVNQRRGSSPSILANLSRGGGRLWSGFQKSLLWCAGGSLTAVSLPGCGMYILVDHCQHFRGNCCLHLRGREARRQNYFPTSQFCTHITPPTSSMLKEFRRLLRYDAV